MDGDAADRPDLDGPTSSELPTGAIDEATPGVDSVLGREVAMVVLPPASGEELEVRTDRVRRLAGLHHPNLVEIFDVDGLAADTESTLVLQNVTGRGLDELTGGWHPESLARVAAQVTAGLAHAHGQGVVHGVIGPASVVVDASLQSWLTGFTATLRPGTGPAAETAAHSGPVPLATPEADVAALGRALRDVLGSGGPVALMTVLTAMVDGALTAREAAERLARAADTLSAGEEDTGLIVVPTRYWRAPGGSPAGRDAPPPTPETDVVHGVPDRRDPLEVDTDPPVVPAAPAPRVPPVEVPRPATTPQSSPRSRHGARLRRVALLSGAAATVALASGFAIWAGEGPSGAASRSVTEDSSGPIGPPPSSASTSEVGRPLGGGAPDRAADTTDTADTRHDSGPTGDTTIVPPPIVPPPIVPPPIVTVAPVLPPPPRVSEPPTSRPVLPTTTPPTSTTTSTPPTTSSPTTRPTAPGSTVPSTPTRSPSTSRSATRTATPSTARAHGAPAGPGALADGP